MEKIIKYKKQIIIFSVILSLITIGGIYYYHYTENNIVEVKENIESELTKNEIIEKKEEIKEEKVEKIIVLKEYYVDVKGAVANPGVYKLTENSIVNDAINAAGGLNKYADTKCINLSKKIIDEMVIYVHTKSETWKILNSDTQKTVESNVICNDVKNDAHVTETKTEEKTEEKVEVETINTLININTDGIDKLTTLPGIGESKAKTIIEYRETNGNFKTIEDLKNVSGIGDSTFEKIKNLITI